MAISYIRKTCCSPTTAAAAASWPSQDSPPLLAVAGSQPPINGDVSLSDLILTLSDGSGVASVLALTKTQDSDRREMSAFTMRLGAK
ncbi:hypothetical protein BHM03_00011322 [Ensete ventricosum]|nr:hypothetical protein BHM03_00011322 [Ensete ventricosum]